MDVGVRLPFITDRTMSSPHVYAFQALGNAEFMRSIWHRYDALATDGDIKTSTAAPLAQVSSHSLSLQCTVTSHFSLPGISAQM